MLNVIHKGNRFLRAYMYQGKTIMHIEHKAGEKLFIDFASDGQYIINPTTEQNMQAYKHLDLTYFLTHFYLL